MKKEKVMSRLVAPVSAPAWGASSLVASPAAGPGDPGPGLAGVRRTPLADLLGGSAILLAWMLLWSWFAVAMVQPAARPRGAPASAAAVQPLT
jgi:hypothetical protein